MKNLKSASMIGIILIIGALFLNGCGEANLAKNSEILSARVESLGAVQAAEFIRNISTGEIADKVQGVIIPHHLLVEGFMEKFYKQLADQLNAERKITRVIIVSPNHFGYGFNFIQSTDVSDAKTFDVNLDVEAIENLSKKGVVNIEPKFFPKEHGVYTHFPFLKKYFPEAKIVPVILKREIPQKKLDALVAQLKLLANDGHTLVIGSIDFSHYSAEDFAIENDARMVMWLKGMGQCTGLNDEDCAAKDFDDVQELGKSKDVFTKEAVAVDSPESIYVMNSLMKNLGAENFQLWKRSSSASLMGTLDARENTSHLFVSYGLK